MAITFPEWRGSNTVLEARREFRVLRQPVLLDVRKAADEHVSIQQPAQRLVNVEYDLPSDTREPFHPDALSLDGEWQLAWREKGAGPPTNGWRNVKVPGSVHTQWLDASKIYSREAEWVSYKEWW